jgi:antitoxin component YwqK of YwqJK toxin-antitoxin module
MFDGLLQKYRVETTFFGLLKVQKYFDENGKLVSEVIWVDGKQGLIKNYDAKGNEIK